MKRARHYTVEIMALPKEKRAEFFQTIPDEYKELVRQHSKNQEAREAHERATTQGS